MKAYRFSNQQYRRVVEASFVAHWECEMDPISDDFTPAERTAQELFDDWSEIVSQQYPELLIPIYWSVRVQGKGISTFEKMPFQHGNEEAMNHKNFLDYFTQPYDPETRKPMNWFHIPVIDKHWNKQQANKGGFIQEVTGWKPSALQPFIYLPTLSAIAAQQARVSCKE